MANVIADPPTRLARGLGTFDAVVVGLGAMLGAGVFVAFAPAARAAGNALLLALALAAVVAWCNATSSAGLAAAHPESGGAYVYGRRRLAPWAGFVAGWGFVAGKLASCAAMALAFGSYALPGHERAAGLAAVVALTLANVLGVAKTALLTRVLVAGVLVALALAVAAIAAGGAADAGRLWPLDGAGPLALLEAAGFLFFAFAGYARIATLGEEVRDPATTIPRAVPIALAIVLALYTVVAVALLAGLGADALAASPAPVAAAVEAGSLRALAPVVRAGASLACLGVLLSLLAGIARTAFAMAGNGDLPRALAAVHARARVPHRAVLAAGAIVAAVVAVADVRGAIGFSSFAVLVYYAVANAAALTLPRTGRGGAHALAAIGLLGCLAIACALPASSVAGGAGVIAAGLLGRALAARRGRRARNGGDPT
jgi:APA family basic amino acid/polyamine antiporter